MHRLRPRSQLTYYSNPAGKVHGGPHDTCGSRRAAGSERGRRARPRRKGRCAPSLLTRPTWTVLNILMRDRRCPLTVSNMVFGLVYVTTTYRIPIIIPGAMSSLLLSPQTPRESSLPPPRADHLHIFTGIHGQMGDGITLLPALYDPLSLGKSPGLSSNLVPTHRFAPAPNHIGVPS